MRNLLIITVMLTSSVHASSLSQDIKKLANLVDVGTNGGDAFVSKYDIKKFNYKPLVAELVESIEGSDCSFVPLIGTKQVSVGFDSMAIFFQRSEAEALLNKLFATKKVKAAIGKSWDGDRGDSEYCSTEELELYFINGEVLQIYYDSTT